MSESHRVGEVAYHTHPSKHLLERRGPGRVVRRLGPLPEEVPRNQSRDHAREELALSLLPLPWTLPLSMLAGMVPGVCLAGQPSFVVDQVPGDAKGSPGRVAGRRRAPMSAQRRIMLSDASMLHR